jgi:hypothetical protein
MHCLCVEQEPGTDTLALPVGGDNEPPEFDRSPRAAHADGSDESAAVADAERGHGGVGQFICKLCEGLRQWREVEVVVCGGFGEVGGALKRENLTRVIETKHDDCGLRIGMGTLQRAPVQ